MMNALFLLPLLLAQTEISNSTGLAAISADLGGCYVLTDDIEITQDWTPLGTTYDEPFYGTLDGRGHTITINHISSEDYQGLFGFIRGTAKLLRLTVEGTLWSSGTYAALVVAHASPDYHGIAPMLVDVHAVGEVVGDWNNALLLARTPTYQLDLPQVLVLYCSGTGTVHTAYGGSGGLLGQIKGEVSWSSFNGIVRVSGGHQIGGLAGNIGSDSVIRNCQVDAEIIDTSTANTYHMGGVAGVMFDGTIMHSWSSVSLEGCDDCGAIVGDQNSIETTDVHWDGSRFPVGCPNDCGGQEEMNYEPPAMAVYCPSDQNRDGLIDSQDFFLLINNWTGIVDLLTLLRDWGLCEHG